MFSDPDRFYTSRQLRVLFPLRDIVTTGNYKHVTSLENHSIAMQKVAADKRSLYNKPAGTVAWLFKCRNCSTVKPFFKQQTATVMKRGISVRCTMLCREKVKPWKRNRCDEVTLTARYANTQHVFVEQITL